jgi:hypothetical protein
MREGEVELFGIVATIEIYLVGDAASDRCPNGGIRPVGRQKVVCCIGGSVFRGSCAVIKEPASGVIDVARDIQREFTG